MSVTVDTGYTGTEELGNTRHDFFYWNTTCYILNSARYSFKTLSPFGTNTKTRNIIYIFIRHYIGLVFKWQERIPDKLFTFMRSFTRITKTNMAVILYVPRDLEKSPDVYCGIVSPWHARSLVYFVWFSWDSKRRTVINGDKFISHGKRC